MSKTDNVVSETRSIWLLSQMFGLCFSSVSLENVKLTKSRTFRKVVYWCTSITVTMYLSIYNYTSELDPNKIIVIQASDILNGISSIIAAIGSVLTSLVFENRLIDVMRRINVIDNRLKQYPRWIPYTSIRRFSYGCILYTFISWIHFLFSYMLTCTDDKFKCFGSWILMFTITKIFDVNLIRFVIHISLIWHKLTVVNSNIIHLAEENIMTSLNVLKETRRINTIDHLKDIYKQIIELGEEINHIYSVSLLLIITNQFVSIFSSLYNCFFGYYINGKYIQPHTFRQLLVPLLSLIHPGGQLLATSIICQMTIAECKHTGKLIFRIPLIRHNKTLMNRITLFSLHILHKKFDITASGFFSINCSLLLMIVGAVTVYLVMFIQFDLASRKQITQ